MARVSRFLAWLWARIGDASLAQWLFGGCAGVLTAVLGWAGSAPAALVIVYALAAVLFAILIPPAFGHLRGWIEENNTPSRPPSVHLQILPEEYGDENIECRVRVTNTGPGDTEIIGVSYEIPGHFKQSEYNPPNAKRLLEVGQSLDLRPFYINRMALNRMMAVHIVHRPEHRLLDPITVRSKFELPRSKTLEPILPSTRDVFDGESLLDHSAGEAHVDLKSDVGTIALGLPEKVNGVYQQVGLSEPGKHFRFDPRGRTASLAISTREGIIILQKQFKPQESHVVIFSWDVVKFRASLRVDGDETKNGDWSDLEDG